MVHAPLGVVKTPYYVGTEPFTCLKKNLNELFWLNETIQELQTFFFLITNFALKRQFETKVGAEHTGLNDKCNYGAQQ